MVDLPQWIKNQQEEGTDGHCKTYKKIWKTIKNKGGNCYTYLQIHQRLMGLNLHYAINWWWQIKTVSLAQWKMVSTSFALKIFQSVCKMTKKTNIAIFSSEHIGQLKISRDIAMLPIFSQYWQHWSTPCYKALVQLSATLANYGATIGVCYFVYLAPCVFTNVRYANS
jgi:hypothetical protein